MGLNFRAFLLPELNRTYLFRIVVIAVAAFLMFKYMLIPIRIQGHSMAPTYKNGGFNFCFRWRYLLKPLERFDVVGVRMAGNRVILLKRIIALEGETIEIRNGVVFVDGVKIDEPYLKDPADWQLLPRQVKKGHAYVIGDNRRVPMQVHKFGQTPVRRIVGGPLW